MKRHLFEPDYSHDFLRWIEIHHATIKDYQIKINNDPKLEVLQDKIIKDNDAALAYYFSIDFDYKNHKMQSVILNSKSAKYGILFAQNIKNADINALQNMIIETNEIKYICKFACFVPGADLKKIQSIILSEKKINKTAKWAHMFIKYIKTSNVNKFKKIILASKKPRYLFELAKHIKNKKDFELIQDLIIKSKSSTYIRLLAQKIKNSNIEKLEQAILELNDSEAIKKFALYVKKSKMRNFIIML